MPDCECLDNNLITSIQYPSALYYNAIQQFPNVRENDKCKGRIHIQNNFMRKHD